MTPTATNGLKQARTTIRTEEDVESVGSGTCGDLFKCRQLEQGRRQPDLKGERQPDRIGDDSVEFARESCGA